MVADGGRDVGLGHLGRSSAVATALLRRGLDVECRANGARQEVGVDGIAWTPFEDGDRGTTLMLDSYLLDPAETATAVGADRLVLMHDRAGDVPQADLVVAPASPDQQTERKLTGLRYACLRPAFWELGARELRNEVSRVLVTTGGADPGGHLAELSRVALDALPRASVGVVRPARMTDDLPEGAEEVRANPLLEVLLDADIVVCGAGQTMLEAAATGTPCITLPLADNQREQAARLAEAGAVRLVEPDDRQALAAALRELAASLELRRTMSSRGQKLVDGDGALRVAASIDALVRAPREGRHARDGT
jgi:spore coat polysaccharide biosynthesis predicted glycosyltransferase SpsG